MKTKNEPLVTAEELEALISGWSRQAGRAVDSYFPLRIWFLILIGLTFAVGLLFSPRDTASLLSQDPVVVDRLATFLYFRGWLVTVTLAAGLYAYLKGRYPGIVFAVLTVMAVTNFSADLFIVYPEKLADPTPGFTVLFLARLVAIIFLFLNMRNASRLPEPGDRLNILLPIKARSSGTGANDAGV